MSLQNKRILLGVTGSIAAYKAADLCSQMGKMGADIHVVLTRSASKFVGEATFRALTRNPVVTDVFDEPDARRIAHIDLAQSADLVLVAPASADRIARLAHGLADDMLSACLLATPLKTPILFAPAMNTVMWENPATVANLEILRMRGVQIVQPGHGVLACQDVGVGKLADVPEILKAVVNRLAITGGLAGKRILVTAGATREPIDPVRFLSNHSSGKMGYAIAEEAARRGATVTLVSGFATAPLPAAVEIVRVGTAHAMLTACEQRIAECDAFIAAAAVADYAPETVASQKIKKSDAVEKDAPYPGLDTFTLQLRRTPDVLGTLSRQKRKGQVFIGFAAETEHVLENARRKVEAKCLDLLVANDVTREGAGFDVDTNIVTFLWPDGETRERPLMSKRDVAAELLTILSDLLSAHV